MYYHCLRLIFYKIKSPLSKRRINTEMKNTSNYPYIGIRLVEKLKTDCTDKLPKKSITEYKEAIIYVED